VRRQEGQSAVPASKGGEGVFQGKKGRKKKKVPVQQGKVTALGLFNRGDSAATQRKKRGPRNSRRKEKKRGKGPSSRSPGRTQPLSVPGEKNAASGSTAGKGGGKQQKKKEKERKRHPSV